MRKKNHPFCLLVALIVSVAGCAANAPEESEGPIASERTSIDGAAYFLESEPADALDVIAAREAAEDEDEVVVVGRVGGSADPWVEGRAAFSIVDRSLKACSDIEGDDCPLPWDYCCETEKLPSATALVKVVDPAGKLVGADARQLLNVRELQTVVVRGRAARDDAGNLTVLATGVFVKNPATP
jgi:hypothetical protein